MNERVAALVRYWLELDDTIDPVFVRDPEAHAVAVERGLLVFGTVDGWSGWWATPAGEGFVRPGAQLELF